MSVIKQVLKFETLRSINSASFTGTYQQLGSILAFPSRFLFIVNNTGVLVTMSTDGLNDHFVLQAGAGLTFDETANAIPFSQLAIPQGTQFWIKGSASTGSVYLTTAYAA